jgi:hypothetical protein
MVRFHLIKPTLPHPLSAFGDYQDQSRGAARAKGA